MRRILPFAAAALVLAAALPRAAFDVARAGPEPPEYGPGGGNLTGSGITET